MTISFWRYSHLALAVSSFLFIILASVTGVILAFKPVTEKVQPYKTDGFNKITLAEAVPVLGKSFSEVTDVTVDANSFVIVKGMDTDGKNKSAYVDAHTGKILGVQGKENAFFQWVTSLHRSLFLHEIGRFFVGLTAFLLMLIAISGTMLIVRRQRGVKHFLKKIEKDNFAQYYHVVLGRLSLIPIIIIALSGTYLSMERFGFFPDKKISHHINFDKVQSKPGKKPAEFALFKTILLSDVQTIEYPFADDPEEYYTLKLKDREIAVNQFTGETLSEVIYPTTKILSTLSLNLHTGRASLVWAIVLAIAAANILFFIYSGFVIMWKRTSNKTKNKYKAEECTFIILTGSENGSTMGFAKAVYKQLLNNNQTVYLTELNNYKLFPKAEHIVVLTSTYGLGDAPANANKFTGLLKKYPQTHPVHFSVVGFGSHAYPDFCRFAFEVNNLLTAETWATPTLEIHTIHDKSPEDFRQWMITWSQKLNLPTTDLPTIEQQKPTGLINLSVTGKTSVTDEDGAFIIQLKPSWRNKFNSGDLLAIYPANDHRERLYSIGKIDKQIQLCVKLHTQGLGSNYLHNLSVGSTIQARIVDNTHFRLPADAPSVVMISNGTGIAPFLGMIDENDKKIDYRLYCGFRMQSSFEPFKDAIIKNMELQKLSKLQVAYSRESNKQYVKDLLEQDAAFIAETLKNKGVLMLCGSLSMQHDVLAFLEIVCQDKTGQSLSHYQSAGQILMDCY
ncbi:PepSY domain-containing protein [Chitinophagaceae bacterium LWZ2-11]